jgi:hypothetical protein
METTPFVNQSSKDWVNHLKQDIRSAQVKAAVRVESSNQPIGISEYELSKLMSENIKSQLTSIEEIEEQVKRIQGKEEEKV